MLSLFRLSVPLQHSMVPHGFQKMVGSARALSYVYFCPADDQDGWDRMIGGRVTTDRPPIQSFSNARAFPLGRFGEGESSSNERADRIFELHDSSGRGSKPIIAPASYFSDFFRLSTTVKTSWPLGDDDHSQQPQFPLSDQSDLEEHIGTTGRTDCCA